MNVLSSLLNFIGNNISDLDSRITALRTGLTYRTYTVTTGTTLYSERYYANVTVDTNYGDIVALSVVEVTSNRPAIVQKTGAYSVRAYTTVSATTVVIGVLFKKY